MVELEELNQYRFYKLEPKFPSRCDNNVENIYSKLYPEDKSPPLLPCNGLLNLHMVDGSVNMICPHVGCNKQYDISRVCSACGREHLFEDLTCDNCEPIVINITSWKVSIEECQKAIKKINRAFKQNLIPEAEWKNSIKIQQDELLRCEKELDKTGIL